MKLLFKRLHPEAKLPTRQSEHAAGILVVSCVALLGRLYVYSANGIRYLGSEMHGCGEGVKFWPDF